MPRLNFDTGTPGFPRFLEQAAAAIAAAPPEEGNANFLTLYGNPSGAVVEVDDAEAEKLASICRALLARARAAHPGEAIDFPLRGRPWDANGNMPVSSSPQCPALSRATLLAALRALFTAEVPGSEQAAGELLDLYVAWHR